VRRSGIERREPAERLVQRQSDAASPSISVTDSRMRRPPRLSAPGRLVHVMANGQT
jgi:hypothetical protein